MGNAFGTTALTPPVMDGGERFEVTNTIEAWSAQPFDIKAHLSTLKAALQRKLELTRPMTLGEFMNAWLREARHRELENDVIRERVRAIRAFQVNMKEPASLWLRRQHDQEARRGVPHAHRSSPGVTASQNGMSSP